MDAMNEYILNKISEILRINGYTQQTYQYIFLFYALHTGMQRNDLGINHEEIQSIEDLKTVLEVSITKSPSLSQELKEVFTFFIDYSVVTDKVLKKVLTVFSFNSYEDVRDSFNGFLKNIRYFVDIRHFSGIQVSTPSILIDLMIQVLKPLKGNIYDGAAGLGRLLLMAKSKNKNLEIYGQEVNLLNYRVGVLSAYINDVEINFKLGDILKEPAFLDSKNELKKFDFVAMVTPLGLKIEDDLVKNDLYGRDKYGLSRNADWFYVIHALESLKEDGKAVLVVSDGALFRSGQEVLIREAIIKTGYIEAIISLPSGIFPETSVSTNLLVLNKKDNGNRKDILFVDYSKEYSIAVKKKGLREISLNNTEKLVKIYVDFEEIDGLSKIVPIEELKDHSLLVTEYVGKGVISIFGLGDLRLDDSYFEKESIALSEVANIYRGLNITSKHEQSEDGKYSVISLKDVNNGAVNISKLNKYNFTPDTNIVRYSVKPRDIIVSCRGSALKIAIVPEHKDDLLISQNFIGIRTNEKITPDYLYAYLTSPIGRYLLEKGFKGSVVLAITQTDLKKLRILVPPLIVQNKIMESYHLKLKELKKQQEFLDELKKQNEMQLFVDMKLHKLLDIDESTLTSMKKSRNGGYGND